MFRFKTFSAALLALIAIASSTAGLAGATAPITGWAEIGSRSFTGIDAFTKSQGMASDGSRIFFSWNLGLHSTGLDLGATLTDNTFDAIPSDLGAMGLNHIGDIDYFDGRIYAPIEDSAHYLHPYVVTYDPDTLQPTGERFALDVDKLTEGVPWVAIDPIRGVAYTAEWNDTEVLNVHRLSDFAITSTVPLSRTMGRIQGAKVYKGMLYASRDNGAEKSIEAIDPVSGEVTHLFDRDLGEDFEAEGIAFVSNASGNTMLTSDIDESDHRVTVHSYRAPGDTDPPQTPGDDTPPPVAGDTTPPAITGLRAQPSGYQRGKKVRFRLRASEAVTAAATWSRCVGKKKPCSKIAPAGAARSLSLAAGDNSFGLAPRSEGWAPGRRFNPGRWRLSLTPTDAAGLIGPTVFASFAVFKPKPKKKPRKPNKQHRS